jgi:hypothetical protein
MWMAKYLSAVTIAPTTKAYDIDDDLSATSEIAHYAAEEHRQGNEVSQARRGRVCRSGHTDQVTASWLQNDEDSVTSKY